MNTTKEGRRGRAWTTSVRQTKQTMNRKPMTARKETSQTEIYIRNIESHRMFSARRSHRSAARTKAKRTFFYILKKKVRKLHEKLNDLKHLEKLYTQPISAFTQPLLVPLPSVKKSRTCCFWSLFRLESSCFELTCINRTMCLSLGLCSRWA